MTERGFELLRSSGLPLDKQSIDARLFQQIKNNVGRGLTLGVD